MVPHQMPIDGDTSGLARSLCLCLSLSPIQQRTQRRGKGMLREGRRETGCKVWVSRTRYLDKAVCGHLLTQVFQLQRLCSANSSMGQMRMTSSEKGTKREEDSHGTFPVRRERLSGRLCWTCQHLRSIPRGLSLRLWGLSGRGHLWWPYSQDNVSAAVQPVTQH